MQAFVLNENRELEVREVPEPQGNDDNIIVKVKSASICGTSILSFPFKKVRMSVPQIEADFTLTMMLSSFP